MKRAKIAALPAAVKQWLDQALAEKNFSGYKELEAELKARGYAIGKSSIHRYGANLERKLAAIKASTEAAAAIASAAPDDADLRSAAVISMIQTEVFGVLVALQEAGEADDPMARAKLLSTVAKNVATLTRASVTQKRHELEIRDKVARAQKTITAAAKRTGASPELIRIVEEQLGVIR